jgi:hypothetical protein
VIPILALLTAVAAVVALGLLGGEPVEPESEPEPLGTVGAVPDAATDATEPTAPSEIDAPWCVALLDLDRPDGPVGNELADTYRSIAVTAPSGLAADLIGAAERIEAGSPVDTSVGSTDVPSAVDTLPDDFDAEGRPVEDDPVLRVAEYVEAVCRATGANPGPPPTEPSLDLGSDTTLIP